MVIRRASSDKLGEVIYVCEAFGVCAFDAFVAFDASAGVRYEQNLDLGLVVEAGEVFVDVAERLVLVRSSGGVEESEDGEADRECSSRICHRPRRIKEGESQAGEFEVLHSKWSEDSEE